MTNDQMDLILQLILVLHIYGHREIQAAYSTLLTFIEQCERHSFD